MPGLILSKQLDSESRISSVLLKDRSVGNVLDGVDQDIFQQRFEGLKGLSKTDSPHQDSNTIDIGILFKSGIHILKITDKGFKQALNDAQKEAGTDRDPTQGKTGADLQKTLKRARRPQTRLDRSLARTISRNQPLTKAQYTRLERMEAAGYLGIKDLDSKKDIIGALSATKDKLSLSKYDCNIVRAIEGDDKGYLNAHSSRLNNLTREGYIQNVNGSYVVKDKFYTTRDDLIRRGLLDPRDKILTKGEKTRLRLPEEQLEVIRNLKQFSNLSEEQIYDIYQRGGQEICFRSDMKELLKRGLIERQQSLSVTRKDFSKLLPTTQERQKLLDHLQKKGYLDKQRILTGKYKPAAMLDLDKEYLPLEEDLKKIFDSKRLDINLYNLKASGNRVGDELLKIRSQSKKYTKNAKELKHDLLQYEAAKIVSNDIKDKGGTVIGVVIDRNRRSEIYSNNFREIGDQNKQPIMDVEIRYSYLGGANYDNIATRFK